MVFRAAVLVRAAGALHAATEDLSNNAENQVHRRSGYERVRFYQTILKDLAIQERELLEEIDVREKIVNS